MSPVPTERLHAIREVAQAALLSARLDEEHGDPQRALDRLRGALQAFVRALDEELDHRLPRYL